ncbi:MAG: FecCD family ABC transporter permease [Enterocloster sp.]
MKEQKRCWNRYWTLGTAAVIFAAAALAMVTGRFSIPPRQLAAVLLPGAFSDVEVSQQVRTVILNIRLPRVLLALLAGAGLSVAGAAFQGLFANPLATPDTLGAANGASFGAVFGILLGMPSFGIQVMAMSMGILAVLLAWSVGRVKGTLPPLMVILAGMVVSSLFSALVSLVKYAADPQDVLPSITYWLMGSMASTTKTTLYMGAPFIIAGSLLLFLLRWKLNSMSLPEDEAASLGIPVKRIRGLVILGAAMVTASVVSMCGQIGWVGLLIPHMVRMIFGNDNRSVIPASMAFGSIFMLFIDTVARSVMAAEIPVSILTALVGAPCFILLLRKTGGLRL